MFNFRSDGRSFANSLRCLIPADGFFEFTAPEAGQKRKTKWRFTLAGQPFFWIAGLVKAGAFAMLTTEPGPDIAPYHDRQIVVLRPEEGAAWLHLLNPNRIGCARCRPGALTSRRSFRFRPEASRLGKAPGPDQAIAREGGADGGRGSPARARRRGLSRGGSDRNPSGWTQPRVRLSSPA